MKILKTLYTATLCAAMAVSTSSCLNSWLDQSPADGIDAETAIKTAMIWPMCGRDFMLPLKVTVA